MRPIDGSYVEEENYEKNSISYTCSFNIMVFRPIISIPTALCFGFLYHYPQDRPQHGKQDNKDAEFRTGTGYSGNPGQMESR